MTEEFKVELDDGTEITTEQLSEAKDKAQEFKKVKGQTQVSKLERMFTKNAKDLLSGSNNLLREEILNYLAVSMFESNTKDGLRWFEKFVHNYLNFAQLNPNSKPAQMLANSLFGSDVFQRIADHLDNAEKHDTSFKEYQIRSTLYDKQQAVFDNNVDDRILIINSRRSGKTELMGRLIVKGLLRDDAHVVYLNRTSSAAIRQIRGPLKTALEKIGLQCIKGSVENQEMHFENGGQLLVLGNNNAADIDKLRGERISMCIMDECGHQRNVKQLMREVIGPALKDYGSEARLYMVGTPPRTPHTYVEELWNNPAIKKYSWTFMDNPFIPERDTVIQKVCEEEGVEPDSAFIRREYLGDMNAFDEDAKLIKKYTFNKDAILPNTLDYAYVGVDFGFEDRAAVISIVASKKEQRAWIVDSWSESHRGIVEISEEVRRQVENLKNNYNLARVPWVITDTNEKSATYDLYNTYKIPNVFTAYKYDKDYALDQLNEFFATGKFIIKNDPSNRVQEDIDSTIWERDKETDKILHTIDDDVWHPNALFAILYASRQFAVDVLGLVDNNKQAKNIADIISA